MKPQPLNPPERAKGKNPAEPARTPAAVAWPLIAWTSGVFAAVLGLLMLVGHYTARTFDPLKSLQLKQAKEQLRAAPTDEALKQRIRELDLRMRQQYFRQLSRTETGTYLVLGGAGLFVLAMAHDLGRRRKPPLPQPKAEAGNDAQISATRARWSVALTGSVAGVALVLLSLRLVTALPGNEAEADKLLGGGAAAVVAAADAATPAEMSRNWPCFRGPAGGVSPSTNAPSSWDAPSGAGILWKVPSPTPGFGSPIVWGQRVCFSGGDATLREVVCLDAQTGAIAWRQAITNVPGSPTQPPEIPESTGYAAATMATDGRRVYAIFANGDVAALTLEGKPVWSKSFGPLENAYGHATSLATWQDRLILQIDQGDSEDGKSKLYALDGRTGQIVWQRPRKVGGSWASPILFEAAGKAQIVALAVPWAIAYGANDGAELWRADCLNGEVTPSPVFAAGLVVIASPSEKLVAIRADGQGDVTKTNIAWFAEDNVPDVTSPLSNGELAFTITTWGLLTCFDAKDGKKLWEHDFEMESHASPTLAGNRLYLFSQKGRAVIVEVAREFKELFRTEMDDAFHASPAFVQDHIILRGVKHIWCLGGK